MGNIAKIVLKTHFRVRVRVTTVQLKNLDLRNIAILHWGVDNFLNLLGSQKFHRVNFHSPKILQSPHLKYHA